LERMLVGGDRILIVSTHNERGRMLLATVRVP
jgi:hypothetical protein